MSEGTSLFDLKGAKFESYSNKINGTIKEAIKQYESRGVSLNQLLSDYNAVISGPNIRKAINPWEYLNKGINKVPVVSGVSTAEALFNTSAMTLYRQKPLEVIKAIYYRNRLRNDSGLEKFFVDSFLFNIQEDKRILVLNPSPFVIEYIEKTRNDNRYLVTDLTMAELYCKQYKAQRFAPLHDMEHISEIDVVAVFIPQADEKSIEKIFDIIELSGADEVYGLMQTRLIDNKSSILWSVLSQEKYFLRDIVIIPNQMSNSSPKKKCMVSLTQCTGEKSVKIQKIEYDSANKEILVSDEGIIALHEELLKCNTVNNLRKRLDQGSLDIKTENVYKTAQVYSFSKEVYLSYAIYQDEKSFYGKVYYSAIKNTQIPEMRGKSLTPRSEKGLRKKTEEDILAALESVPYRSNMTAAIIGDVAKNYLDVQKPVTLKTLWFCQREHLLKNHSYDDVVMRTAFSGRNSITDIYPGIALCDEIKKAVAEQFKTGEEVQELRLLKQINMIIETAISSGYLSENRVLPLLPLAQSRASKRQTEVRQALAKRSFEAVEEERIVRFLKTRYKENSTYLAVGIRMFTGMSIKEVCGLQWNDLHYDKVTGVYTLTVTKYVDNNGKLVSHALEENWDKYRVLPLDENLCNMILSRKQYLVSLGVDESLLMEYPIILARESIEHMRKGYKAEYCKPYVIAGKCREAVTKAEIPSHVIILPENGTEIETNINSYGGDIFRTNFRDKALNDAGFGLDELNYYLGLKKPDTFSQHYCDYTNDYVQLIMAKKLDRWTDKYSNNKKQHIINSGKAHEMITGGIGGGVPSAEIEVLTFHEEKDKMVTINVETEHGFDIIVTPITRGDTQ